MGTIRSLGAGDRDAILALARRLSMFDEEGLELIDETMSRHLSGEAGDHWLVADDGGLAGVLYCAPEPMASGTWNVLMLLVDPDRHASGHGRALMERIEERLRDQGERLLIVETSSLDGFERAREFYPKCGFGEEARIRDFYASGDDKVVFRKALSGPDAPEGAS